MQETLVSTEEEFVVMWLCFDLNCVFKVSYGFESYASTLNIRTHKHIPSKSKLSRHNFLFYQKKTPANDFVFFEFAFCRIKRKFWKSRTQVNKKTQMMSKCQLQVLLRKFVHPINRAIDEDHEKKNRFFSSSSHCCCVSWGEESLCLQFFFIHKFLFVVVVVTHW